MKRSIVAKMLLLVGIWSGNILDAIAQPTISSISASHADPATSLSIMGANFNSTSANNIVYFGATRATVTAATTTSLTVTVPYGALFSPVTVSDATTNLSGYSLYPFLPSYNNSAGTVGFDGRLDLTSGNYTINVAIGDLDGDGKPDMVVANYNDATISIYRNNSATGSLNSASFPSKVDFSVGSRPYCVALGDIDGDGKLDISVVSEWSDMLSVFPNTTTTVGSITLGTRVDLSTANLPTGVTVNDFDMDGKPDIAVANWNGNSVYVYRGTGSFTFASPVILAVGTSGSKKPVSITSGDVDGDGWPDIVTCNHVDSSISIFHNATSSGTFGFSSSADIRTTVDNLPYSVTLADFDGDGKLDIAVANGTTANSFSVFPNTTTGGSIAFGPRNDISAGNLPIYLAVGDLDGDGKPDVVVASKGTTSGRFALSAFLNNSGTGISFTPGVNYSMGGRHSACVAIGDLDGDGRPDIIAGTDVDTISIFKNDTLTAIGGTMTVCVGGSTLLTESLGGGTWSSSNSSVATVGSSTGVVTGISAGIVTISYTVFGGSVTTTVTVTPFPSAITGTMATCVGASVTLNNATSGGTWTSSNTSIATVGSATGIVSGVAAGSATISYTLSSGCTTSIVFTVVSTPPAIIGDPHVCIGSTATFSDVAGPGTWSSSNTSIATVGSTTGQVTGVAVGTANISYTLSCGTVIMTVTVGLFPPVISSLSLLQQIPGNSVVITGSGFNSTASNNIVYFGATQATVTAVSTSSLTVTVPVESTYMPVTVDNLGCLLIGYSQYPFLPEFDNSAFAPGTVNFEPKFDFATGTGTSTPWGVAIGDIDGDGYADLAVVNSGSNTVSVYRNLGVSGPITSSSFAAKVDFTTGTGTTSAPYAVAFGDLDRDGKLDMVVSNLSSGSVSVFRNTASSGSISSSSFATKFDISTGAGSNPWGLAINDIDMDGRPDIVVVNNAPSANKVSVFHNVQIGSGLTTASFSAKIDFTTGANPNTVAVGDIDGDGKPDVVVTNGTATSMSILRNTSLFGVLNSSSLAAKVDFTTGSGPLGVALGDIDGDGKLDIAVSNSGTGANSVSVFRNTSTSGAISSGSLATRVDFTTGTTPYHVALGDIDGDGKTDVIVANNGSGVNTVSVLRNTASSGSISSSSLAPKADIATGAGPRFIAVGDLDGDFLPDLAVANFSGNTISVIRNHPLPPPPTITAVSPVCGYMSSTVTVTGTNFNPTTTNNIVYFGATEATVTAASTTSLSVTVPCGALFGSITENNIALNLSAYSPLPFLPSYDNSAYTAGTIYFSGKVDFTTTVNPFGVAIGDVDGDGKPDIAVVNSGSNTVSVYRNTSTGGITSGSFAAKVDFVTGTGSTSAPYAVAFSDLDGDGKLDMVVTNQSSSTVSVFRNTASSGTISSSSFAAKVDFSTGTASNPYGVTITDIDMDGRPDLIVTNSHLNTVSILRNVQTGSGITSGSFATKVDFTTGASPQSVAVGDIDGDGKPDVVVANNTAGTISVFRNTSAMGNINNSSLAAKVDFTTGTGPLGVAVGDLDGDGKLDIAVTNSGTGVNTVSVYRNTSTSGTISSSSLATRVDFTTGTAPYCAAIGDIDGDCKPDLITANSGSNTVSILRNTASSGSITSGSFATKVDFATGSSPRYVAVGDLDCDGMPDLTTSNFTANTLSILRNNPGHLRPGDNGNNNSSISDEGIRLSPNPSDGSFIIDGLWPGAADNEIFPAHWDPKLRIPRGQVVAAASIVSPKY